MAVIGVDLDPDELVFQKNRDFKWTYQYVDDSGSVADFPEGYLYFEFETSPTLTQWPFTISGSTASLVVEEDLVADIPSRCKWQLVFKEDLEDEGGFALARGMVRIQS